MLTDLELNAADVPLFVGEVEYEDMGGGCYGHNTQVARIPKVIPTGHVVSAKNIPGNGTDPWHFSAMGYRIFGKRYAFEVLKTMGLDTRKDPDYKLSTNLKKFFTPQSFDDVIVAKANSKVTLSLWCTYKDGHREDVTQFTTFASDDFRISNGTVRTGAEGQSGIVTATFVDFVGEEHVIPIRVGSGASAIAAVQAEANKADVYTLQGVKVGTKAQWNTLPRGLYIMNGKKYYHE